LSPGHTFASTFSYSFNIHNTLTSYSKYKNRTHAQSRNFCDAKVGFSIDWLHFNMVFFYRYYTSLALIYTCSCKCCGWLWICDLLYGNSWEL